MLNITAQTLSSQMQRGIMVINLTFMVFCWCNMLYYERRRNFLVLVDVLNKNTVLQYLENNGNVVSFTVEVKNDGATEIVGVSKSCQRLYGYYPTEVVGRPDESFISAGHAERVKAYNRRAVEALTRVGEDASPADQDRKVKRRLRYFRVLANSQVVRLLCMSNCNRRFHFNDVVSASAGLGVCRRILLSQGRAHHAVLSGTCHSG